MTYTAGSGGSSPRQIGRYQIEGVLGRGAMGTVYLASDPHIQRKVALKTIRGELLRHGAGGANVEAGTSSDDLPARFINEARAAGRLVHPNIVSVFDYGEADGVAYIALEYVPGENLAQRLAQHADAGTVMPLVPTLVWFSQLLDALAYAHDSGIIHRDIKPANLLITPRGECKVTDFGVAQLDTGRLTQVGMLIGTPSYMSPEQYAGASIDARSDLFSAGVVLYEMLTGVAPFAGTAAAMMHRVMNETPLAPSSHTTGVPTELDAIVQKALAKRPEDRYTSAQNWRIALLALVDRLTPNPDPERTVLIAPGIRQALDPPQPVIVARGEPVDWPPELLVKLEESLATHVGPVAARLVRRAAAHAASSHMLETQLARHLPNDAAREALRTLLNRHASTSGRASRARGSNAGGNSFANSGNSAPRRLASAPVDAERVSAAATRLASHIGPIARIVAERAARGADEATFYARLAEALPASVDKQSFLRTLTDPTR
jgi:eukaryotic-like serine/threonine-protein kinase